MAKIEHFSKGYTREWLGCIVATWVFLLSISVFAAEPIRGIYGAPSIKNVDPSSYVGKMEKAGINAVFVPPEKETVKWFKAQGNDVYVSVNAFGGKGAWKDHPDSRPVKSDGSYLGSAPGYKGHGGVCPTHTGWRRERLKYIESLVREFGGKGGIDGIWLDFVRYPGLWEVPEPEIPDTCYCPRCLYKFQKDREIKMPTGLSPMDGVEKGADRILCFGNPRCNGEKSREETAQVRPLLSAVDQRGKGECHLLPLGPGPVSAFRIGRCDISHGLP